MGMNVKTGECIASYAHVWKPKEDQQGNLKFSICLLVPKDQKADIAAYRKAIKAAFKEGQKKFGWPDALFNSPKFKTPLRDGDEEIKVGDKKKGIGYEGMMFFNANANGDPDHEYYAPPEITKPLNGKVVGITDQSEFYSGCVCRAAVSFYAFNNKSKGIAVGLNALFKVRDGDRLDGRESAQSAFSDFASEYENLEGDQVQIESDDPADPSFNN